MNVWINLYGTDSQPIRLNTQNILYYTANTMEPSRTDIVCVGGKRLIVVDNYSTVRGKIERAESGISDTTK